MKWTAAVLLCMGVAFSSAGEEFRLASIIDMTKYLDSAGGVEDESGKPAEAAAEETAPAAAPDAAPAAPAAAEPELPEFTYREKNLEKRVVSTLENMVKTANMAANHKVNSRLTDLLGHNDQLGAARVIYRYGFFERAYGGYHDIISKQGYTRAERDALATGVVDLEALRMLVFAAQIERAKHQMPKVMGKVKTSGIDPLVTFGDDTLALYEAAKQFWPVFEKLDKAANGAPADEAAKRKEAVRLIAYAGLASGTDGWRYGLEGNPATDKLAPGEPNRSITGWAAVYTDLNMISDKAALLGYKDAEPFAEDLNAMGVKMHLPYHKIHALGMLISRFPGHQVVQSGEAFLHLADALADLEAYDGTAMVCQLAVDIAPDAQAVKEGEMNYMAAEALFRGKRYRDAITLFRSLQASAPEHRANMDGTVMSRITEANKRRTLVE
ncbi:MAG: hypothetical protein JW909_08055 [Planctomycetes bacterium]|nr:hypothetical protein [Planctomycetota bacterium]